MNADKSRSLSCRNAPSCYHSIAVKVNGQWLLTAGRTMTHKRLADTPKRVVEKIPPLTRKARERGPVLYVMSHQKTLLTGASFWMFD